MELPSRSFPLFLSLILLSGKRMTGVEKAEGQFYGVEELERPFCGLKNTCCKGRQDGCSLDREGGRTKCYCDEFCLKSHSAPHQDCCWDYWHVCRNISYPLISDCYWENNHYPPGTLFRINCYECQCVNRGHSMEIMCSYDKKCLIDADLIKKVNQEDRGWRAGNVTTFWGKTLNEGLLGLLGTNYSSNKVRTMFPVRTAIRLRQLPDVFDWRQKNANYISPIENQHFCNSSWVFSIVSTFSDSLTTSSCYPRSTEARCQIQERGLAKRESVGCPGGGVGKLYRASALSRIASNESAIRREIYDNGPVIATMRVFPELFAYKGGVYSCPKRRPVKAGSLHSVKLLGWGLDSKKVPYWIAANSWGREWGEDGFFRIRRGSNECHVEEFVLSFSLDRRIPHGRNTFTRRLATNSSFYSLKIE